MSDAQTGMAPIPALQPIEDDGESEDAVDEPDERDIDLSDTPDDDRDEEPAEDDPQAEDVAMGEVE
jgi:hypothetical protein